VALGADASDGHCFSNRFLCESGSEAPVSEVSDLGDPELRIVLNSSQRFTFTKRGVRVAQHQVRGF
jgi:hypothetical protein